MPEEPLASESTSSSSLAWFLTGAAIGLAAGMLLTPKSGKETRQRLSESASRGKAAFEDTSRDFLETGRDMFERGRKLVEDASELFERGRKLVRG